jgi:hypothetical protein
MTDPHKAWFIGGPLDGKCKEVRGAPLKVYVPEQPDIDFAPLGSTDPSSMSTRKRHIYFLCDDGSYEYTGIE